MSAIVVTACARDAHVEVDEATLLVARANSTDSLPKQMRATERSFARVEGRLVPVRDTSHWPPGTESEVRVLFENGRGRVDR
jgi:hypothetical protein